MNELIVQWLAALVGSGVVAFYMYLPSLKIPKPSSLPLRAFSSREVVYSWEDWRKDSKEAYPVRYFLTETLPDFFYRSIGRNFNQAVYWLRTHTYNRYHFLDLRNPFYKWGWVDCDSQILYACFNILKSYVEEEDPFETIDWEWNEEKQEQAAEIKALYLWWTVERKQEHDQHCHGMGNIDDLDEKDDLMLHRLINIRGCLWT